MEVLAQEFWVPGSTIRAESGKYAGIEQFAEILTTTNETALLYMTRACEDSS